MMVKSWSLAPRIVFHVHLPPGSVPLSLMLVENCPRVMSATPPILCSFSDDSGDDVSSIVEQLPNFFFAIFLNLCVSVDCVVSKLSSFILMNEG